MDKVFIDERSFKSENFGVMVLKFRKALGLTQEDFGKIMMLTRRTIIKIEQLEDFSELSDDLLFRLNHLSFRLMINEKFDDLVRFRANEVYNATYSILIEKIIDDNDKSTVKLIKKNIY